METRPMERRTIGNKKFRYGHTEAVAQAQTEHFVPLFGENSLCKVLRYQDNGTDCSVSPPFRSREAQ
ncbi:MAG: hypothetical protein K0R28_483 [Paenibacillus sp.]|jgi:hypothetical protein|nr:hypothetical protein [Paenibacillus sp.]